MKDLESFNLKLDLSNILLEVVLSVGKPLESASESRAMADLFLRFGRDDSEEGQKEEQECSVSVQRFPPKDPFCNSESNRSGCFERIADQRGKVERFSTRQ